MRLVLGLSQSKCSSKLIGFDLLATPLPLLWSSSFRLVAETAIEAGVCSIPVTAIPENKGIFSLLQCSHDSPSRGLNIDLACLILILLKAFVHTVMLCRCGKGLSFLPCSEKPCAGETWLKIIFGKYSGLYFNHSEKNGYMLITAILSELHLICQVLTDRHMLSGMSYLLLCKNSFSVSLWSYCY